MKYYIILNRSNYKQKIIQNYLNNDKNDGMFNSVSLMTMNKNRTEFLNERKLPNSIVTNIKNIPIIDKIQKVIKYSR